MIEDYFCMGLFAIIILHKHLLLFLLILKVILLFMVFPQGLT